MSTIKSSDEHLTLNADGTAKEIKLQANGVEKAKVTSTGIDVTGTVTTDGLEVVDGNPSITIKDSNNTKSQTGYVGVIISKDSADADTWAIGRRFGSTALKIENKENSSTIFETGGTERMRIDASGNLFVDCTAYQGGSSTETGSGLYKGGLVWASRSGDAPAYFNRIGSDGDIAVFRKDGTTEGAIGVVSNQLKIYATKSSANCGIGFYSNRTIRPLTYTGAEADNLIDLGYSGTRWDDIYATNGTIQTSDRNEKQDIEELSEAEQRVAVACKGLMRKYRWKDAVAEKGDDARIHFGIIAQDLQDAFEAEGLDAHRYAMFISTTWWETQTEVPAVEAVAEQQATYDDEGNELTPYVEAVEAKEAYTRTDTYETQEEAPEGATERTRLGVRYPELLAFIISAV